MKKKEQNLMKLTKFCRKYKFVSSSRAQKAYVAYERPYTVSMQMVGNRWFIDVKRYIYEMRKEYPQIDDKFGDKIFILTAQNIKKYKIRYPKSSIFKNTPRVKINIPVTKKIGGQEFVKLAHFCNKYKFITSPGMMYRYQANEKSCISSMKKINDIWHINIGKYIQEMYKKHPQIDGYSTGNNDNPLVVQKMRKYLKEHPKSSLFEYLKFFTKKVKKTPIKKIQKIAKKTLKKYLPPRTQKLDHQSMIDGAMSYLLNEYEDEDKSCDEFKIIFLETIEEYLMYLLKEMDKKSA